MGRIIRKQRLDNRRRKTFYRQDEMELALYTTGDEYMNKDGVEYSGPYHRYTLTGEVMSEAEYDINKSFKLYPVVDRTTDRYTYVQVSKRQPSGVSAPRGPRNYRPNPKAKDYERGFIVRYFVQRRNDVNQIIEIDKKQAKVVRMKGTRAINQNIWRPFSIQWKITGPEFDVLDDKGNIIEAGVVDTNKRTVFIYEQDNPAIVDALADFREFSIYSATTGDAIKEQFRE